MAKKNTDYVKYYENFFGIKWDRKKYEVHHIDHNRENNDISNLILLPKKVHRNLHTSQSFYLAFDKDLSLAELMRKIEKANAFGVPDFTGEAFIDFIKASEEMKEWGRLKYIKYLNAIVPTKGNGLGERIIMLDGIWNAR